MYVCVCMCVCVYGGRFESRGMTLLIVTWKNSNMDKMALFKSDGDRAMFGRVYGHTPFTARRKQRAISDQH